MILLFTSSFYIYNVFHRDKQTISYMNRECGVRKSIEKKKWKQEAVKSQKSR